MQVKIVTTACIKKPKVGDEVSGWFFSCGLGFGSLFIKKVSPSAVFFTDGRRMRMRDYIRNELEAVAVKKKVIVTWRKS